jgi:hypothetical protein
MGLACWVGERTRTRLLGRRSEGTIEGRCGWDLGREVVHVASSESKSIADSIMQIIEQRQRTWHLRLVRVYIPS